MSLPHRRRDSALQLVAGGLVGAFSSLGIIMLWQLPHFWLPAVAFLLVLPFVIAVALR
jgi:hypothetical protein